MSTLRQLQGEIASRMRRGDAFASVEEEVIDPSPVSAAEKAALWLYGWSFVDWRRQRREGPRPPPLFAERGGAAPDRAGARRGGGGFWPSYARSKPTQRARSLR